MRAFAVAIMMFFLGGCATTSPDKPADEISAGMDKEGIRKAIREHIVPIRHCYESDMKKRPAWIYGKLVLEWDIEDDGKVSKVAIKDKFLSTVDSCIASVIKETKFPAAPKGQVGRVVFPFVFTDK